jgi:hypothetical protein
MERKEETEEEDEVEEWIDCEEETEEIEEVRDRIGISTFACVDVTGACSEA